MAPGGGDGSAPGSKASTAHLGRAQVLPENAVVHVATAVELERGLERNHAAHVPLSLRLRVLGQRDVEVGHIRRVVLAVVQRHYLARDDRRQRPLIVGKVWQHNRGQAARRRAPDRARRGTQRAEHRGDEGS